jgi:L,D-transpeptidase ErfK/SrfK
MPHSTNDERSPSARRHFGGHPIVRWGARSIVAAGVLLLAAAESMAAPIQHAIGIPTIYEARDVDTLLDIARTYDVGYVEIRVANPNLDPWMPGAGSLINIPTQHLLPAGLRRGIVINLPELRLYYFPPRAATPLSFPIGIGDEGKETPVGHTTIARKAVRPTWIPTRSEHDEDPELPNIVPPGPDNPMGDYALYLARKGYAIHGTNKPYSIGRRDSHGCIRMYPEDIKALFKLVSIGTSVTIIDTPVKLGWVGDVLYLEVHPQQSDADAIETDGYPTSIPDLAAVNALIKATAAGHVNEVDWDAVLTTELERTGMPMPITNTSAERLRLKPSYSIDVRQ